MSESSKGDASGETAYFKYDRHTREFEEVLGDEARRVHSETWFRDDTFDAWRHNRMRAPLKAIIEADPEASWLTVGDGRYGTDAHFLIQAGAKSVHASDISDALLKIGAERGFITEYSAQNAEALRFPANSFDYIYCKESYHHFPRPYAALYEMFRVARKGILLTEPRDQEIDLAPFKALRRFRKWVFKNNPSNKGHGFEPVGNYIYTVSERELEKFMLGMHYTDLAFIGCNDAYEKGVENIRLETDEPSERAIIDKLQARIAKADKRCKAGTLSSGLLTAALFKKPAEENLIRVLERTGWSFKRLPKNPYLEDA